MLQRAGVLAREVKERWKLCWPMAYLPKREEPSCPFCAVGMQTRMSKEGAGEAAGELPTLPALSIWKPEVFVGQRLPVAGGTKGVVCCAQPSLVLQGRTVGAVSAEAVGNISREVSEWAPAPGFTGLLICLDLALGGEKPSIVCTSDAAVVQGGPIAWLWLFCPVKTLGCPRSPPPAVGCAVSIAACGLRAREQERGGRIPREGREGCGVRASPFSCVWAGERVSVARPGDKNAL